MTRTASPKRCSILNSRAGRIFFICCLVFTGKLSNAQSAINDTSSVRISSVHISGNKKTKEYIILREMQFHAGDTVNRKTLPGEFIQARNQVYNTNLFTEVKIDSLPLPDSSLQVNVHVKEKWYIYPTPQFQLADRNFNEWIKTYHASLNRVVYGVKFAHYNFSGRHDQLRIYLLNGYSRNFSVSYNNPYINPKLTQGLNLGAGFTQNREISYATSYYNKLINYRKTGFVRSSFTGVAGISKRTGFFKRVSLDVYFNYIMADDSLVSKYNPNYFNSSKRSQTFPDISLNVSYINTDNINYPLKGLTYGYGILKRGLQFSGGINSTLLQGIVSRYIPHGHNWYSNVQLAGIMRLPFKEQAYINRRAIGYGNLTLRGLEYYVVDGVAASVGKYTLSKKLMFFDIPVPFKIKAVPVIPVKIYAKAYGDAGYSYIPHKFDTFLNNRLLYTGGVGLDIVTLYDVVLKVEYSINQLGEKGLFLHGKAGF